MTEVKDDPKICEIKKQLPPGDPGSLSIKVKGKRALCGPLSVGLRRQAVYALRRTRTQGGLVCSEEEASLCLGIRLAICKLQLHQQEPPGSPSNCAARKTSHPFLRSALTVSIAVLSARGHQDQFQMPFISITSVTTRSSFFLVISRVQNHHGGLYMAL